LKGFPGKMPCFFEKLVNNCWAKKYIGAKLNRELSLSNSNI
jgi:hypothetical protein